MIILLLALLGLLVFLTGANCTTYMEDKDSKAHLVLFSEITFVISGVLHLIPICCQPTPPSRTSTTPRCLRPKSGSCGLSLPGLSSLWPCVAELRGSCYAVPAPQGFPGLKQWYGLILGHIRHPSESLHVPH